MVLLWSSFSLRKAADIGEGWLCVFGIVVK